MITSAASTPMPGARRKLEMRITAETKIKMPAEIMELLFQIMKKG
jgi:hypothetical protein